MTADPIPDPPKDLDGLRDAIAAAIERVTAATPKEEITLENADTFSDSYTACIEAMRDASVLAFNYVADQLGVTGFQASVAALQAYGTVMHIDGPFMMQRLEDALYPQYDLPGRVLQWMDSEDSQRWLVEQATLRLSGDTEHVAPGVLAHWEDIKAGRWPLQVDL